MEMQLFLDRSGVLSYDDARGILELRWIAGTDTMTDDDFMRWLERFAAAAPRSVPTDRYASI
jgi:truncated hemoglobin YjbI